MNSQSLMHSLIALSRSASKTVIKDQNFSDNGERLECCSSRSYNLTLQSNVLAVANKNRVNDRNVLAVANKNRVNDRLL